jgi:hypothetical protein
LKKIRYPTVEEKNRFKPLKKIQEVLKMKKGEWVKPSDRKGKKKAGGRNHLRVT